MPRIPALYRLLSLFIVAPILLLSSQQTLYLALVTMGQAHFFMVYLYQWKAGKIDRNYLIGFAIKFVLVVGAYMLYHNTDLLLFIVGIYFVFHFLADEQFLIGKKATRDRFLDFAPILVMFLGVELRDFLHVDIARAGLYAGGVLLMARLGLMIAGKMPMASDGWYFFAGGAGLFTYTVLKGEFPPNMLLAIINFHYMVWYFHFFSRFKGKKLATYIGDIIWVNLLMVGLMAIFILRKGSGPLGYLFNYDWFDLWTLMHYLVTPRPSDLAYFFRPRPALGPAPQIGVAG